MKITKDSHVDHGLSQPALDHLVKRFADRDSFFIETINLDDGNFPSPNLKCGLYGPLMGDEPVDHKDIWLAKRLGRDGVSPLLKLPFRSTRQVTVIAGPHEDEPCVLFTSYGGPVAPREPWDEGLKDDKDGLAESTAFWSEHGLAKPQGMALVRLKQVSYEEVKKRLDACEIACEPVDRPGGTHPDTGHELVCLAVQCTGNRFHAIIEDLADVVYPSKELL